MEDANNKEMRWIQEKLDGMQELLGRLETLRMEISDDASVNLQDLLGNTNLISHLTGLDFLFSSRNLILV